MKTRPQEDTSRPAAPEGPTAPSSEVQSGADAAMSGVPNAAVLTQTLFQNVPVALSHGLQLIFFWSAIIMSAAVLLHLALKSEPLRTRTVDPDVPVH